MLSVYAALHRNVSTGATVMTAIAPKFSDTLILSQPRGIDSAHHIRCCSQHFPAVTSLAYLGGPESAIIGIPLSDPNLHSKIISKYEHCKTTFTL